MSLYTNHIILSFTPPAVAPANGYRVKYRASGSSDAYNTVSPNPTSSPVVIDGLDGTVTGWEGTIESDCSGLFSEVATFDTNTFCGCGVGYTPNISTSGCEKITTVAATAAGGSAILACHFNSNVYTQFGTAFYQPSGYGTNGAFTTTPTFLKTPAAGGSHIGTLWANPSSNTTDGRLNHTGIWKCGAQTYSALPLGFSRQIIVSTSKVYYIGMAADNYATIKINGTTIVSQSDTAMATAFGGGVDVTFKYWHVYPVTLNAGINLLEITGTNAGSIGIFGCEIYDATQAELIACTNETDLTPYLIFTTADIAALADNQKVVDNDPFEAGNYNCDAHPGYALLYESGSYVCKLVETTPCGGPVEV